MDAAAGDLRKRAGPELGDSVAGRAGRGNFVSGCLWNDSCHE